MESSQENASAILKALEQFGMGSLGITVDEFLVPDQVVQLCYPPIRIDILVGVSGVGFADCYPQRVKVMLDGVEVNFIDLENLKKNKKASGRLQDLADLENLE